MNFEQHVVKSWVGYDNYGSDYYFYDCELNPTFFVGAESDLAEIEAEMAKHGGKPTVYFSFDDTGFIIQIYSQFDASDKTWAYEGVISRGTKIIED